ncbi:glutamyl-tRNA reductase [Anoxybacter fermentans]|uniref:glutamyl-tRNA reductase n=1 Tax=Anoxybacter fermentans TaxID=1323375 RepID=UPI0013E0C075|nr:glutamyl-tRNA reductase [Anoxybacter fermentans]
MRFFLLGANYKTAPLELREKMALTRREIGELIQYFLNDERIDEGFILTTCNRTEFYFLINDLSAQDFIWDWLVKRTGLSSDKLKEFTYTYLDRYVVNHLFKVACGLDSMVLGEGQILSQVREAYQLAAEAGGISTIFYQLLNEALRVGKKIRSETKIARNGVSIPVAAVELVKKIFPDLSRIKAMVLGAGEMGQLALELLYNAGVKDLVIVNRSKKKRYELAQRFGGTPFSWEEKRAALTFVDLVISSTSAPHYVVKVEDLKEQLRDEKHPLVLIDIAVPRDVEPGVEELQGIKVFNIDDLQQVAYILSFTGHNEIQTAEEMIKKEEEKFARWLEIRKVHPIIKALRERAEEIRRQEMNKMKSRLEALGENGQEVVMDLTHKIIAKLLHEPTVQLKKLAIQEDSESYLSMVCQLYNLKIPEKKQVR